MGLPHLMHHLQTYGERVIFHKPVEGGRPDGDTPTQAVIDGPALAYHVYYICLSKRGGARNALEAIPSYHELGRVAVSWLDQIEQYGISV